ncbi:MAG TPA: prepilin-type N-terminal cleavage/methylation domain-containing protein [Blastocatellia bacterium]|nr:prepilin-type N-terminal cleavage/methylation domain-containing protein [Blastocatellia bacterium]
MFRRIKINSTTGRHSRPERGFSMIEMVVILLVIALIAGFVVPQVINYMRKYRLGVASRNVATALQRARFLATSNNKRAGVFIPGAQQIDIEEYDPLGKAKPEVKGTIHLPEGIKISDDAPKQIAFDGRGVVTPLPKESQTIRVNGVDGYYMIVTVSATGQVTISDALRK